MGFVPSVNVFQRVEPKEIQLHEGSKCYAIVTPVLQVTCILVKSIHTFTLASAMEVTWLYIYNMKC